MSFKWFTAPLVLLLVCSSLLEAQEIKPKRVPWTTSHLHGSPEPPKPFLARRSFPMLQFKEGVEIVFQPVLKRWFVVEREGRIVSFPQDQKADKTDLVVDLKALHPEVENAYGLAFHPRFADNHLVFVCYTHASGLADGTKLSRFVMKSNSQLDVKSEKLLLTWRSGGHNGGNLQFGPDGMLYFSAGDSEVPSPPDPLNTGQDISDLLSSIMRIDVDHEEAGMAYAIPKDNPFVTTPKARGEVWAYGLRNPWKMSFDRTTGRLWCGDVGWELWESVHLITRGGNYGWSAMEASQSIKPETKNPLTQITPPVVSHTHDEAASITGGYVYHGKKFPELVGAYLYGDWVTGKIWALWHDGKQVTRHEEIADTHHKIIAFGQDADGEILYLDYSQQGSIYEVENNPVEKSGKFPMKLSETGLFSNAAKLEPAEGVYEFEVTQSSWHDSGHYAYWIALPNQETIHTSVATSLGKNGEVKASYKTEWPKDSVLVKMIYVESPTTREGKKVVWTKRVETQILHFTGVDWNAYSYRWNDEETDAELVPASGAQRDLIVAVDQHNPEKQKLTTWHYQSRAECIRCHNSWTGYALAYQPSQLDSAGWFPSAGTKKSRVFSQLDLHQDLGLIESHFAEQTALRLSSAEYSDPYNFSAANQRARSYLHANCSHCHRANAGGAVSMMLNAELLLGQTLTVGVTPQQGGLGLANPKLIDAGNPWNSVIALRIAKTGTGHMPIIGPREVDVKGLKLIEDWIARMGNKVSSADELLPKEWTEDVLRESLKTVEGAMQVLRAVDDDLLKEPLRQTALSIAWKSPQVTVRDLFDRFKPEDQRERTLGARINTAEILALKGDAGRGSQVLSLQGKLATCFACHFIDGTGRDFGPDLSKVGARLNKAQILESIAQPSKVIAPGFAAVTVVMKDGSVQTGFMIKEEAQALFLKTATGQTLTLKKDEISKQTKLPTSLMPEGLLQSLTAQEVADVIAFLELHR